MIVVKASLCTVATQLLQFQRGRAFHEIKAPVNDARGSKIMAAMAGGDGSFLSVN